MPHIYEKSLKGNKGNYVCRILDCNVRQMLQEKQAKKAGEKKMQRYSGLQNYPILLEANKWELVL